MHINPFCLQQCLHNTSLERVSVGAHCAHNLILALQSLSEQENAASIPVVFDAQCSQVPCDAFKHSRHNSCLRSSSVVQVLHHKAKRAWVAPRLRRNLEHLSQCMAEMSRLIASHVTHKRFLRHGLQRERCSSLFAPHTAHAFFIEALNLAFSFGYRIVKQDLQYSMYCLEVCAGFLQSGFLHCFVAMPGMKNK